MMNTLSYRTILATGALLALVLGGYAQTEKPNILFIYLDDLGYGDVTCYNPDSKIHTPNIDRLAKEGMAFTDAHTPAPICGPSRYGLMTGRYPWRRGKGGTDNGDKFRDVFVEKGRTTLASLLKKEGYNTAQIGKWGIRHNYSDAVKPWKGTRPQRFIRFPEQAVTRLPGGRIRLFMVHDTPVSSTGYGRDWPFQASVGKRTSG
ncbi:MAG: sulfatase-like hydrolase/transferase [Phycisphaerae bacterium]|nr:sulfatase-like hydrolase/transferase [Phycisphaerae bacterium]